MPIVKLLEYTPNAEKLVAAAAKLCYSNTDPDKLYENLDDEKIKGFIQQLAKSGHLSPFEHASFSFVVYEVSRNFSHQMVRHRTGIAFSQRSQRYCDSSNAKVITPPSILNNKDQKLRLEYQTGMLNIIQEYQKLIKNGFIKEDARFILPGGIETAMMITVNARELIHIASLRLCKRSQWEIRDVVRQMVKLAKEKCPNIFANVGPSCITEGKCKEHLSCKNPYKSEEEMLEQKCDSFCSNGVLPICETCNLEE